MRRVSLSVALALSGALTAFLVSSCSDNGVEPNRTGAPAHIPIALATASTASGATFTTDKDDYAPGDTLKLAGAGWQPGDTLDIHLDEDPQNHPPVDWAVGVDENGGFQDSTYVVQDSDAGVTFALTATSRATGETATATFTDGSLTAATLALGDAPSPCTNTPKTSFTLGDDLCATTTITTNPTSPPAAAVTDFSIRWLKGATLKHFLNVSNGANGQTYTDTYEPDAAGTDWVVQVCTTSVPASGPQPACAAANVRASVAFTVTVSVPNLTITKVAANPNGNGTDSDPDWYYGIENSYTVTVTNSGNAATSGSITVTDTLPSQLTYNGYTGADWTCPATPAGPIIACTSTTAIAATNGTSSFNLKVIPNTVASDVVNRASVVGGGDASSASSPNSQVDILPAPTTSAAGVKPSSQQYSDKTELSDTVTTASTLGTIAGTVYFYVGSAAQACGASAPAGSVGNAAIVSGVATYEYTIDKAAGSYTVTACFYSSNTNFTNSDDTAPLTVTKEDATVDFPSSNPLSALVNTAFSLTATIRETNPELNPAGQSVAAGDISNAVVNYADFKLQNILGGSAITTSNCTGPTSNGSTGYAEVLTITCTFAANAVPVGTYAVQVTVSGDYYTGYGEDVFTVYDPSLGFITGGGRYMLDNERVNFGFTVKYNKKGTQPQGSLLVVRHHADGTTTRAKSNALSGLAVNSDGSATFSGKANYYDETGTWLGNLGFSAYAKDVAEPGINKDLFGLYVAVTDANGVATSSTLTGLVASAKVIVGGNIQVPHK